MQLQPNKKQRFINIKQNNEKNTIK